MSMVGTLSASCNSPSQDNAAFLYDLMADTIPAVASCLSESMLHEQEKIPIDLMESPLPNTSLRRVKSANFDEGLGENGSAPIQAPTGVMIQRNEQQTDSGPVEKGSDEDSTDDWRIGQSLHSTGDFFLRKDDLQKALEMFYKAARTRRRVLGRDHLATASSMTMAGVVLFSMGEYMRALPILQKALRITQKACDPAEDLSEVGRMQNNLACVLSELGHYYASLAAFDTAIRILSADGFEKREHHPVSKRRLFRVTIVLSNLGHFYLKWKRFDLAKDAFRETLAIQNLVHGPTHERVLATTKKMEQIDYLMNESASAAASSPSSGEENELNHQPGELNDGDSGFFLFKSY